MLTAMVRLMVGAVLGALFLLVMAIAALVDLIETSRAVRRTSEPVVTGKSRPQSENVLMGVKPS